MQHLLKNGLTKSENHFYRGQQKLCELHRIAAIRPKCCYSLIDLVVGAVCQFETKPAIRRKLVHGFVREQLCYGDDPLAVNRYIANSCEWKAPHCRTFDRTDMPEKYSGARTSAMLGLTVEEAITLNLDITVSDTTRRAVRWTKMTTAEIAEHWRNQTSAARQAKADKCQSAHLKEYANYLRSIGYSHRSIAKKVGRSISQVYKYLQENFGRAAKFSLCFLKGGFHSEPTSEPSQWHPALSDFVADVSDKGKLITKPPPNTEDLPCLQ